MSSSLARQLSQSASLNVNLLSSTRKHRHYGYSYLFDLAEAGNYDLDAVYGIGQNGFTALSSLDPILAKLGEPLFNNAARSLDRTTMTPELLYGLKLSLYGFLRRLTPLILEIPAGKALEWLVRKFRVNEFDVDVLLEVFLPYHDSTEFSKILLITQLKPNSTWSFLIPFQKDKRSLPRLKLINAMIKDSDLARLVVGLARSAYERGDWHRVLGSFCSTIALEYMASSQSITEGALAFLLPSFTQFLSKDAEREMILCSFVVIAALSHRVKLSDKARRMVLAAALKTADRLKGKELLMFVCSLYSTITDPSATPGEAVTKWIGQGNILALVSESLAWRGSDSLYASILTATLKEQDPGAFVLISTIIQSNRGSTCLFQTITNLLLSSFEDRDDGDFYASISETLAMIYQRKPEIFHSESLRYAEKLPVDQKPLFSGRISDITLGYTHPSTGTAGAAALSDNPQVRIAGLRRLVDRLVGGTSELQFSLNDVGGALTTCLQDPSPEILSLLYSQPEILIKHIEKDQIVLLLDTVLTGDVPRAVARLHLDFLAQHVCKEYPDLRMAIFQRIFKRFILFTKPRQKLAHVVWQCIRDSTLAELPILKGCTDFLNSGYDELDLAACDLAITTQLADNLLRLPNFDSVLPEFARDLANSDVHTRTLAFMTMRALLQVSSGMQRLQTATVILESLPVSCLEDLDVALRNAKSLGEFVDQSSFIGAVISKPSSPATLHRLTASILALLPGIPKPEIIHIEWLRHAKAKANAGEGHAFVQLSQKLYGLANSSSEMNALSTTLLRALFVALNKDVLLFLAGIWTDENQLEVNRRAAISHGKAFLLAQLEGVEASIIDFQTIVPSLLIALSADDQVLRMKGAECIRLMVTHLPGGAATIYAVDMIYGVRTERLQIISTSDSAKYLQSLSLKADNFVSDASYLDLFHRETLGDAEGESIRRISGYQQRIVCWLLSHAVCWEDLGPRTRILATVQSVHTAARLPLLFPLIRLRMEEWENRKSTTLLHDYTVLLFASFDDMSAAILNAEESIEWETYKKAVAFSIIRSASDDLREIPLAQIPILFPTLTDLRKGEIYRFLLCLAASADRTIDYSRVKRVLVSLMKDVAATVSLLTDLSAGLCSTMDRPPKRSKLDEGSASVEPQRLVYLAADALTSLPASGSPDLIVALLETLHGLQQATNPSSAPIEFSQQLLLTALDKELGSLKSSEPSPAVIHLDSLVELIRTTNSPQTSQQALLILAKAVQLDPDAIIRNIMPIFTFMGSHLFPRDDAFSFRVVQKTVDSLIPVLTSMLRKLHPTQFDLLLASKEYLRIFTDACTHVPRHRRNQFYIHLVETFGADVYLSMVLMLLVDRAATRIVRQTNEEVDATLAVPLAILHASSMERRALALHEILDEVKKLVVKLHSPEGENLSLLNLTLDEHSLSPSVVAKRQALALVIFVEHGIIELAKVGRRKAEHSNLGSATRSIITDCIELVHSDIPIPSPDLADIREASRKTLIKALAVTPALDFIGTMMEMVKTENEGVRIGSLTLFSQRLPSVTSSVRSEASSSIIALIQWSQNALGSEQPKLRLVTIQAIGVIALDCVPEEHAPLLGCVDAILTATMNKATSSSAFRTLSVLIGRLGPRMIPYISLIADCSLQTLKETEGIDDGTVTNALELVLAVVRTLPNFLGHDLSRIIYSCILHGADKYTECLSILDSIAEKVSSSTLMPILAELEFKEDASPAVITTSFLFARRALERAKRIDVSDNLKLLFNFFLRAFEQLSKDVGPDSSVVEAFSELISKLNETTFKPLFRRFFDWAFTDVSSAHQVRQMALFVVLDSLMRTYKSLMVSYMAMLLDPVIERLNEFATDASADVNLWTAVMSLISTSFDVDEGVFWRDDRLGPLVQPLSKQLYLSFPIEQDLLTTTLANFGYMTTREELLQSFNSAILTSTQSEEVKVQLLSLKVLSAVWKRSKDRCSVFVTETLPFIEDLAESENDDIAKEARTFKRLMDQIGGFGFENE